MKNPELRSHTIDTATMFALNTRAHVPWLLTEYRTPKTEIDAELEIQKRTWSTQKKAQKDERYVTKRGFYMDYDLKVAKSLPASNTHGAQPSWISESAKKSNLHKKIDPKIIKNTFLDQIKHEQKKRKIPGVCTYSLQKSIKQKDAEREKLKTLPIKATEKVYYYENTETLSNEVPGVGSYMVRHVSPKQRVNKSDYKFWAKKHRLQGQEHRKRQQTKPGPASHTPLDTTIVTFDQLAIQFKKPSKKHHFGKDAKFQYTRPSKKAVPEKRPGPLAHAQLIEWPGKGSGKKLSWNEMVWRGHSQTVYH